MQWETSGNKEYIKSLEGFEGHSVDFISEAANWSISELKKMNKNKILLILVLVTQRNLYAKSFRKKIGKCFVRQDLMKR